MKIEEYKKNYLEQGFLLEHSILVSSLSLKMFQKLLVFFPVLEKFNNRHDLKILEYSALLHDIGVPFENKMDKGHHKIGRDLILKNKITGFNEDDVLVAANVVRYHRRALPDIKKHKYYKMLSDENREKTDIFSAIVRLCDGLDANHYNLTDDFEVCYNKDLNVLTIKLLINIMLNIGLREILDKKKLLLEKVFNTEVLFD